MESINDEVREKRNAYLRAWRKKNPEKVRNILIRYWMKKETSKSEPKNNS
jgi:hypothetical protein